MLTVCLCWGFTAQSTQWGHVSLPNHTFTGQAKSSKRLTSTVHILLPETDNCPSWISGRERMTVENISWSISTKECCRPRQGLNPPPPGLQSDGASNWATEAGICWLIVCCCIRWHELWIGLYRGEELLNFITCPRTSKWSKSTCPTKIYLPENCHFFLISLSEKTYVFLEK